MQKVTITFLKLKTQVKYLRLNVLYLDKAVDMLTLRYKKIINLTIMQYTCYICAQIQSTQINIIRWLSNNLAPSLRL